MSRLGFLLLSFVAATTAFVARPIVVPAHSGKLTYHKPVEDGTSLHVGIAYGPSMITDDNNIGSLQRSSVKHGKYSKHWQPFDFDPSFSAISIAYPIIEEAKRDTSKWTRAIGASTAILVATVLAKLLVSNYAAVISALSYFFKTYPLQASMCSCGLNALVADLISQVKTWKSQGGMFTFEIKKNLSAITYGVGCMGIFTNLAYTKLFPVLFGVDSTAKTILAQAFFDNFINAPLLWLPPAYLVKTLFFDTTAKEALGSYFSDVKNGLLFKYWGLWVPAQILTFSVVPKHLRVAFMASISFVWFMILSSLTSKKEAKH